MNSSMDGWTEPQLKRCIIHAFNAIHADWPLLTIWQEGCESGRPWHVTACCSIDALSASSYFRGLGLYPFKSISIHVPYPSTFHLNSALSCSFPSCVNWKWTIIYIINYNGGKNVRWSYSYSYSHLCLHWYACSYNIDVFVREAAGLIEIMTYAFAFALSITRMTLKVWRQRFGSHGGDLSHEAETWA